MIRGMNPGNVQVRLGVTLGLIEQAFYLGELERAANLIDLVATYLSVHMTDAKVREYEAMPGFGYGDDRGHQQVFQDLNARLRFLLRLVQPFNVFSKGQPEYGDSSEMDVDELVKT